MTKNAAILVFTRYRENYGDAAEPYWKSKGGSEYLITGVDGESSQLELDYILDAVRDQIEYDNEYALEYILGYKIVSGDFKFEDVDAEYAAHLNSCLKRIPNPRQALEVE